MYNCTVLEMFVLSHSILPIGGKGFFVELDSLTFIMVALGGALFLVIILTLAMIAICVWTPLILKRRGIYSSLCGHTWAVYNKYKQNLVYKL